jgi:choline dehydrogenase-like flavoprotein
MIADLQAVSGTAGPTPCQVTIIGAGTAGCLIASELSRAGISVLVLESGGATQEDDTHPLNRVVQSGEIYRGAERGRFRCLGGLRRAGAEQ